MLLIHRKSEYDEEYGPKNHRSPKSLFENKDDDDSSLPIKLSLACLVPIQTIYNAILIMHYL